MGNILGLCAADMIIVGIMDGQYFVGSLVLSYCDYSQHYEVYTEYSQYTPNILRVWHTEMSI